jgi:hypothetical protein
VPFEQGAAAGGEVGGDRLVQPAAVGRVRFIEQVAAGQHHVEALRQPQRRDVGPYGPGQLDVGQHVRRVVHRDDRVAEPDQRIGDPADAAAQVEHGPAGRRLRVHQLRLAGGREEQVGLDRAPVAGDRAEVVHRPEFAIRTVGPGS